MAGRWRMRLIGALSPLPAPNKNEVNASFHTRELRDYYVPNDKKTIFRYIFLSEKLNRFTMMDLVGSTALCPLVYNSMVLKKIPSVEVVPGGFQALCFAHPPEMM